MTDARLAREALLAARTGESDSQLAREAILVARTGDSDAQVARIAILFAYLPGAGGKFTGWGMAI